jgi:ADP-ribose pyrophosphatase YjhB (NUDIX family)
VALGEYTAWLRARVGTELIVMPSVGAVIRDDAGRVLLQLHAETGEWGLPGGAVEPEEHPEDAIVREVREETGLEIAVERLIGVYGGPDSTVVYRNGDRTSYVRTSYLARVTGGELQPDDHESLELRWVPFAEWRSLVRRPIVRRTLEDAEAALA